MKNLVLVVTMECVYQSLRRDLNSDEKAFSRAGAFLTPQFLELCFLTLCDPERAIKRLYPNVKR